MHYRGHVVTIRDFCLANFQGNFIGCFVFLLSEASFVCENLLLGVTA